MLMPNYEKNQEIFTKKYGLKKLLVLNQQKIKGVNVRPYSNVILCHGIVAAAFSVVCLITSLLRVGLSL